MPLACHLVLPGLKFEQAIPFLMYFLQKSRSDPDVKALKTKLTNLENTNSAAGNDAVDTGTGHLADQQYTKLMPTFGHTIPPFVEPVIKPKDSTYSSCDTDGTAVAAHHGGVDGVPSNESAPPSSSLQPPGQAVEGRGNRSTIFTNNEQAPFYDQDRYPRTVEEVDLYPDANWEWEPLCVSDSSSEGMRSRSPPNKRQRRGLRY
jgi:hypothetical protein